VKTEGVRKIRRWNRTVPIGRYGAVAMTCETGLPKRWQAILRTLTVKT